MWSPIKWISYRYKHKKKLVSKYKPVNTNETSKNSSIFFPMQEVGGDSKGKEKNMRNNQRDTSIPQMICLPRTQEAAISVLGCPAPCGEAFRSHHVASAGETYSIYCKADSCREACTDNRRSRLTPC